MKILNRITHTNADENIAVNGRVNRLNVAKANANTFALDMIPIFQALEKEGIISPSVIAETLNERSVPTARGGKWAVTTVTNLIGRLAVLNVQSGVTL
ncbi:MAG: hypothetical protein ACRYF6_11545 [Janthinobacterium lividum]